MDDRKKFACLRNLLGVLTVGQPEKHADDFERLRVDFRECCSAERVLEHEAYLLLYVAQILTFIKFTEACKLMVEAVRKNNPPRSIEEATERLSPFDCDPKLLIDSHINVNDEIMFQHFKRGGTAKEVEDAWYHRGQYE